MDIKVYQTQCWLNETYGTNSAFQTIDEDGITGTKTIKALIRALQIELGIEVDGIFGAATASAFSSLSLSSNSNITTIKNQIYILQGALYCKGEGLNPIDFNGKYTENTRAAVELFESYAGLTTKTGVASAMILEALLNTDAYTLLSGGDSNVRTIQQALNNNYYTEIGLIPCDGIYSRKTNRALISGLQYEERKEYSNTVVDGIWGDATMNRCPTLQRYGSVTNKQYVYLLQYALYVNGYDPNGFDGGFGAGVQSAVKKFQAFAALTSDGIVGKFTWASLLVSYGDKSRSGTACDCKTPLTEEKAATLVNDGRVIVGRYLTGGITKRLTQRELSVIYNAGLHIMPIYQTTNNKASYFTSRKGKRDAYYAYEALVDFNFPENTIVYFAVDFDATEDDVKNNVIPYFAAVRETFLEINQHNYKIGIYGPRYVCTLVKNAGYTCSSFVCDMSSGFLCNMGHTLPMDWAFDQIATITIGTGTGSIEIDNDIASGRDDGSIVNPDIPLTSIDSDKAISRFARVERVVQSQNIDLDLFKYSFEYEKEFFAYSNGMVDVYFKASINYELNSEGIIEVDIVNGKFESVGFESRLNNILSTAQLDDCANNCIDFSQLAVAIDYGKIIIKLETDLVTGKIVLKIIAVLFKYDSVNEESDVAVEISYVFKPDDSRPDSVPEEVYNKVVNWFQSVDWEHVGEVVLDGILIGLIILGLVLTIIYLPEFAAAIVPFLINYLTRLGIA